jgi:hypothetical protein
MTSALVAPARLASLRDAPRWVVGFPVVSSLRSSTTGYPLRSLRLPPCIAHPGGMSACSRWSRALAARTPPDRVPREIPHPGRGAIARVAPARLASLRDAACWAVGCPVVSSLRSSTTGYPLRSLRLPPCIAHPGGMSACSRWSRTLAARTPPDRVPREIPHPGRGAIARVAPARLASLRDAPRWVVGCPVVSSLRSSTTGYPLRSLRLPPCIAHPGGMSACSRWSRALAARTPPDRVPREIPHPGRGASPLS